MVILLLMFFMSVGNYTYNFLEFQITMSYITLSYIFRATEGFDDVEFSNFNDPERNGEGSRVHPGSNQSVLER